MKMNHNPLQSLINVCSIHTYPVGLELETDIDYFTPMEGVVIETPENEDPDKIWIKWEDDQIGSYEFWWCQTYCIKHNPVVRDK